MVQKFWTSCISFTQKIWGGPEILDQLYCNHTAILGRSRNSGSAVLQSYSNSGVVQKFWTKCILFIQAENLKWSRNSGPIVLYSYRNSGVVQKFWICCIAIIQKIWAGPEILDQLYSIHTEILGWSRNSVVQKFWTSCISLIQKIWGGPEILDQMYFIQAENLGWSRNSGPVGPEFC